MRVLKAVAAVLLTVVLILGMAAALWQGYDNRRELEGMADSGSSMQSELSNAQTRISDLESEVEVLQSENRSLQSEAETWRQQLQGGAEDPSAEPQTESAVQGIEELEAGTVLEDLTSVWAQIDQYFCSYEISDEIFARIQGLSYGEGCDIPLTDLRYLKVLHYNFDGKACVGELIVNAALAEDFLEIFKELFMNQYEIYSMYLVDNFGADDYASIEANNTSAFNYRLVSGGSTLSNHAFGFAVDINPQQNPYVEANGTYYHENAAAYVERAARDHMITHEDLCYQIFTEHGFTWGGDWSSPVDYQHFEKKLY